MRGMVTGGFSERPENHGKYRVQGNHSDVINVLLILGGGNASLLARFIGGDISRQHI